jgi:hypothetical protein
MEGHCLKGMTGYSGGGYAKNYWVGGDDGYRSRPQEYRRRTLKWMEGIKGLAREVCGLYCVGGAILLMFLKHFLCMVTLTDKPESLSYPLSIADSFSYQVHRTTCH